MKKLLSMLLSFTTLFTFTTAELPEDHAASADSPSSSYEYETMPMDGDYSVMPLASNPDDFNYYSLSDFTFLSDLLSQFDFGEGNYSLPFKPSLPTTIYLEKYVNYYISSSDFEDFFSRVNDKDSYIPYYYFTLEDSGIIYISLYAIPKSFISIGSSQGNYKHFSEHHFHYGFPDKSPYNPYLLLEYNPDSGIFLGSIVNSQYKHFEVMSFDIYRSCLPLESQVVFSPFFDDFFNSTTIHSYYADYLNIISDKLNFNFVNIEEEEYIPPSSIHTLTVNYLYSEDNPAADPVIQELSPGEEYTILSPEIEGYTPSIPLVTGTMPDEDLTIDVYYTKAFYPLTVKYQYQDGRKAADDITFQYPMGFSYDIPSPEIEGYTADKPTVSGTMPGRPLEEVVTYFPTPYTLSVFYQYENGTQAAETHREQLTKGAAYSVTSPTITGYKPDHEIISGTMPAKDVYFTVIYKPDSSGGDSGGGSSGGGGHEGGGDNGDGDGDGDDDNKGGDSGGGSSGGGWTGNDPFIPSQPPFSGYDPFDMSGGLPDWIDCPFHIRDLPSYTYDPFVMPGGK